MGISEQEKLKKNPVESPLSPRPSIYRTRAMANCGYSSFFPLLVMKLQLKNGIKKKN